VRARGGARAAPPARSPSSPDELTPFVAVETFARDVLVLRALLDATWPVPAARPLLVTNDANPDARYLQTLLTLAGAAVDVATWHVYIAYGLDPKLPSLAWSAAEMDKISADAAAIVAGVDAARGAGGFAGQVWVGESAFAWHSGQTGITDTFESSPWWLSALSQLAPTHSGFCRQTLIGGRYELVNKTTRAPNPDFYVARLFKDAMGPGVFAAATDDADVRAYAQCAPGGGLSVSFINFGNTTVALSVQGPPAGSPRELRVLSAVSGNPYALLLNGNPLVYVPGSGALPSLAPVADDGAGPLIVEPRTLGFVTYPDAHAYDC